MNIPRQTQQNGTLFLHILLVPTSVKQGSSFVDLQKVMSHKIYYGIFVFILEFLRYLVSCYILQDIFTSYTTIKMTQYTVPEAEAFKLLSEKNPTAKKTKEIAVRPVSHINSRVTFTIMTDNIMLPEYSIPAELMNYIKYIQMFIN